MATRLLKRSKLNDHSTLAALFHGPTFIILVVITLGPLLYSLWISLFNYRLSSPGSQDKFIGLQNYLKLFNSPEAWKSMLTTFNFMLMAVLFEAVLGMAIAMSLNAIPKFRRLFTSALIIPMMVAPLVVGLMFGFFLNPQFGLFQFLVRMFNLPLPTEPLGTPFSALAVVALTDIWEWTPYMALMFLAGLQSIPGESYEAAKIDGAGTFQTFRYVTIPLMRPIIVIAMLLRAMEAFKEFDKPYILTGGGPGSATEVIDMFTYRQAFVSFNFSYAAAICIVLFILLLVCGVLYGKFVMREEQS